MEKCSQKFGRFTIILHSLMERDVAQLVSARVWGA